MVLVVKCLICNKELTYTQSDPSELHWHLKNEHPQRTKILIDSRREREKSQEDLRRSLKLNAQILKKQINKEVQTSIDWRYFERMSLNSKRESHERSSRKNSTPQDSPNSSDLHNITVIEKSPKTFTPATSSDSEKVNERTPLKTASAPPVLQTSSKEKPKTASNEKVQAKVGRDAKVYFTKDESKHHSKPRHVTKGAKYYKTSIERWRPVGDEKIHCPRCQSVKRPVVRVNTERITETSIASTFLMTCWPLCFAPCLFPVPTHENLHCPVCNYHLGIYNHQTKAVKSNPELAGK